MPRPAAVIRAATYRRISDDREGLELGVQRQEEDLRRLAADRGYLVVADYSDNDIGASTRSRKRRPGYEQMIRDAAAGQFHVILAYTSGRLTRRPREREDLIELAVRHGVRIEYVNSPSFDLNTADGRMIARHLAAQDTAESERIAERVSRSRKQRAERGLPPPGASFGYSVDGMRTVRQEAAAIRRAYADVLAGTAGLRTIATRWNAAGLRTRWGNTWQAQTVASVLRNPRYAALPSSHRQQLAGVTAQWTPLVERGQWEAVQQLLDDPSRRTTPGGSLRYLLSGVAVCGVLVEGQQCGSAMASGRSGGVRSIKCRAARHLERRAVPIEEFVISETVEMLDLARNWEATIPPAVEASAADPTLLGELTALEARRGALAGNLSVPEGILQERADALDARIKELRRFLGAQVAGSVIGRPRLLRDLLPAAQVDGEYGAAFLASTVDVQRAIIAATVSVLVLPVGRGSRGFDPASVRIEPLA